MKHLRIAAALMAAGLLVLMAFWAVVWPPGALLSLAAALFAAGVLWDVPKKDRKPPGRP